MTKLICAPMATLSHEAFRRAVEKFGGCDEYFTEMINASSLLTMGPFEKYYLLSGPVPEKIVWQVTGWDSSVLGKAAKVLALQGGIGVDINMGCSAPQIYKTGAGISWMLKPLEETALAVRNVRKALEESERETGHHMRLSVKCRLGAEDYTDEGFFSFTDMLVNEGVEMISLHPRTIKEKNRLNPKYQYVQLLKERYGKNNILVIANGNIKDTPSAQNALLKAPGADGLMIARAAASKPWIFDEIKTGLTEPSLLKSHTVDRRQLAYDFIDDVVKYQPEEFWKTRIQRFFNYYCEQFSFGHYFQSKMLNYKGIEEAKEQIRDYFEKESGDILYRY